MSVFYFLFCFLFVGLTTVVKSKIKYSMNNKLLLFLTLILFQNISAQVLHHQMLSAQGTSSTLPNGLVVKQTIGQQSAIGNSKTDYYVGQGFQQSRWSSYIESSVDENIKTFVYPNPFIDSINFQFSTAVGQMVLVRLFNIAGIAVYTKEHIVADNRVTVDLGNVPEGVYLVSLSALNFSYFTKILKKL